jgi:hypothetical protein
MLLRSQLIYNHIIRSNVIDRFNIPNLGCLPKIDKIRVSCRADTTNLWAGVCLLELLTGQRAIMESARGVKSKFIKDWYDVFVDLRRRNMYVFLDWFMVITLLNFSGRLNVPKKLCSLVSGSVGFSRAGLGGVVITTTLKNDFICVKIMNLVPFLLRISGGLIPKQVILELDDFVIEVFIKNPYIGCSINLVANTFLSSLQLL